MPYFDRLEFPRNHNISTTIKFVLFIIVILAIIGRSVWINHRKKSLIITNVEVIESSRTTIDVGFMVTNAKDYSQKREFLIKVYDDDKKEIGSRMIRLDNPANSTKRYRKVLSKFKRPLGENEKFTNAEVTLYEPSIF